MLSAPAAQLAPPVDLPGPASTEAATPGVDPLGFVGVGGGADASSGVPIRVVVGRDRVLGPFGARLLVDYGRQSGGSFGEGTLAAAAHVTLDTHVLGLRPYAGVGGGYQFDLLSGGYNQGAFAGGLVGVEVPVGTSFGIYLESDLDYYFTDAGDASVDGFQPQFGVGVRFRF